MSPEAKIRQVIAILEQNHIDEFDTAQAKLLLKEALEELEEE